MEKRLIKSWHIFCQLFMLVIIFGGCISGVISCSITTLPSDVSKSIGQTESKIKDTNNKLDNASSKIKPDNYLLHSNTGYFGNQTISHTDADFLPPEFSNQIQIDQQFMGIHSIVMSLTELAHIPVILDVGDPYGIDCTDVRITQHEGNLIDVLNMIVAKCDLGWTYKVGKIILSDTETKTWVVKGIPGDVQVQNQINNSAGVQSQSAGTNGSGGQSQVQASQNALQNTVFNLQNSLWGNLTDAVRSMLSKTGKLSISPATSSLTATDKPSVLLRVDNYMKTQNAIMSRQVQIDVQVLNVDVDAADNYGINWGLVLNSAAVNFSINGQSVVHANPTKGGGFTPSPIFVPSSATQAFTLGVPDKSGALSGSSLIINALSSIAKTSLVTTAAVTTLSNQPVPVQFVDQRAYLASVTTTVTQGGTSQTAVSPGQLTTGFSLNVLPVIQADGRVFLQLSLNISALKKMAQFSTEGAALELPETIQRNFMQKAVIKSGDTFILTGFDSDMQELTNIGVGGAYNWILGGGVKANKIRSKMVILVTPRVVNI